MIILITTSAESMYEPFGPYESLQEMRRDVSTLATALVKQGTHRLLWIDSESDESFAPSKEEISVVHLIPPDAIKPLDPYKLSLIAARSICAVAEEWCRYRDPKEQIVIVDNADSCLYPHSGIGALTSQLDKNRHLIENISTLGECLAQDYNAHLLLLNALSNYPKRMSDFMDKYGWSWIWHRNGTIEHRFGALPVTLQQLCQPAVPREKARQWSSPMSVKELALLFGVHRNTMTQILKTLTKKKVGGRYQVDVNELPQKRSKGA